MGVSTRWTPHRPRPDKLAETDPVVGRAILAEFVRDVERGNRLGNEQLHYVARRLAAVLALDEREPNATRYRRALNLHGKGRPAEGFARESWLANAHFECAAELERQKRSGQYKHPETCKARADQLVAENYTKSFGKPMSSDTVRKARLAFARRLRSMRD